MKLSQLITELVHEIAYGDRDVYVAIPVDEDASAYKAANVSSVHDLSGDRFGLTGEVLIMFYELEPKD